MFYKVRRIVTKLYSFFLFYCVDGTAAAKYLGVTVGEGCRVYIRDFGTEPFLIEIGKNVTITKGVNFLTHDGATCLVKENGNRYYKYGAIKIGSNVFIGVNSVIMPNVSIGDNVIVGTGSVVTKNIPDNSVYAGSPAKFVMSFEDYTNKVKRNCANYQDITINRANYIDAVMKAIEIQNEKK